MSFPNITVEDIMLVNYYYTERPVFGTPSRECHLLAYSLSGDYLHDFSGSMVHFVKGNLLFIHKDQPYRVKTVEPGYSMAFAFVTKEEMTPGFICADASEFAQIRQIFQHAYHTYCTQAVNAKNLLFSDLYRVLALYQSMQSKVCMPTADHSTWNKAVEFIRRNYARHITLADISEILGVGERRTRDLFLQHQAEPFSKYLMNVRLNAATDLLKTGAFSVSEIADQCGFSDVYYFSKCFKKHFGISPSAYRKQE